MRASVSQAIKIVIIVDYRKQSKVRSVWLIGRSMRIADTLIFHVPFYSHGQISRRSSHRIIEINTSFLHPGYDFQFRRGLSDYFPDLKWETGFLCPLIFLFPPYSFDSNLPLPS